MSRPRQTLGAQGERLARKHLESLGYHILETNLRSRLGELDIVAQRGDELVFFEVRTRRGEKMGLPQESIGPAKRERLVALAQEYIQAHPEHRGLCRIDLVAVQWGQKGQAASIEVIENAVEEVGILPTENLPGAKHLLK